MELHPKHEGMIADRADLIVGTEMIHFHLILVH